MKAIVDQNMCIGCGMCAGMAPEIFQMNSEGQAEGYADGEASVIEDIIDSCPVAAISGEE